MIKEFIGLLLLIMIILLIVFIILKHNKISKYNERLGKYTVNNNRRQSLSLGDNCAKIYQKFRQIIVKYLNTSFYFENKIIKYEKYSFIDSPVNLIATKICLGLLFGFVYLISSLYKKNFDLMFMLLFMVIGYLIYNVYLIISENRRNKLIASDLLKAIIIMNTAFKSGYNIFQAINFVSKDLNGPISDEFKKIGNDLNYGLEIKDVFDRFYERVHLEDVKYITSSLSLLNLTGGNLVGVFNNIEKSFTNKKRLKDELNAMTSSSRLVFYILLVMPAFIISILLMLSPSYFSPLLKHPLGILLCFVAIVLYIFYIIIIRKILKVEA